jgi:hypothetical protein
MLLGTTGTHKKKTCLLGAAPLALARSASILLGRDNLDILYVKLYANLVSY